MMIYRRYFASGILECVRHQSPLNMTKQHKQHPKLNGLHKEKASLVPDIPGSLPQCPGILPVKVDKQSIVVVSSEQEE
jgi:hypothetical protein